MSDYDPEAEIVRTAQERMKKRKTLMYALIVPIILLSVAAGLAGGLWFKNDPTLLVLFMVVGGVCGGGIVAIPALLYPIPKAALTQRIWRRRTDEVQRGLTRFLFLALASLILLCPPTFIATLNGLEGRGKVVEIAGAVGAGICASSYLAVIMGWGMAKGSRVIWDEELFQSFRAQGLRNGFWTMAVGVIAAFALGFYRPALGLAGLPSVLLISIAVIALTIAILSRRAEKDA